MIDFVVIEEFAKCIFSENASEAKIVNENQPLL